MRIELEEPYRSKYKSGYKVWHKKEGRWFIVLIRHKGKRTSTAFARYLMAVKIGRFLSKNEEVDHVDDNKANDSIDNLQILSKRENVIKSARPRKFVTLTCPVCKIAFTRAHNRTHLAKGGNPSCCSRKCGGKASHLRK